MLLTAAFFVLSQQTALEPPASGVAPVAPVGSGAAREVLPGQRWTDFEAHYSCAVKPETFFDERTGGPAWRLPSAS